MRGRKPSWIACLAIENAPEITACDAMTAAMAASTTTGATQTCGNILKNGFSMAVGSWISSAPWPM